MKKGGYVLVNKMTKKPMEAGDTLHDSFGHRCTLVSGTPPSAAAVMFNNNRIAIRFEGFGPYSARPEDWNVEWVPIKGE